MSDNKPDPEWGCEMSRFKSNGTKEDTIKKIFGLRDCIREQQKSRLGKWFCYVTAMVGIQKNADGTWFSGKIKPEPEKFVVTITEVLDDDYFRKYACEEGEYGLANYPSTENNTCLANFKIEFSPRIAVLDFSEDTYSFNGPFSHFVLYGPNGEFELFQNEQGNSYVTRGRCEKIN